MKLTDAEKTELLRRWNNGSPVGIAQADGRTKQGKAEKSLVMKRLLTVGFMLSWFGSRPKKVYYPTDKGKEIAASLHKDTRRSTK